MGLFRIAFLVLTLVGGFCLALVSVTPDAFESTTAEAAGARLRSATVLAATLEEKANQERLRFATEFATSPLLTLAVSPGTAEDGSVVAPTNATMAQGYREAARTFLADTKQNYDLVALFDPNGSRIDSTSVVTTVASEDFAAPGRVREVGSTGQPLGALAPIAGRIFGIAAVPVRNASGAIGAVLLIAEEYGDALVAERRTQLGFPLALHVDHDIVAHDLTDPTLFSTANSTVMKLERGSWAAPGKAEPTTRAVDGRTIFADTAALATSEANAPFRSDVGIALVFDAPAMHRNLLAILVDAGAFDEIPGAALAAVAGSLMFFFLGLLLLDMELRGPARRLAKDVSGLMTTNHPAPLDASKYGNHLRSLVSAINEFIESKKTFVATKRTKVDTAPKEAVAPVPTDEVPPAEVQLAEVELIPVEPEPLRSTPLATEAIQAEPSKAAPPVAEPDGLVTPAAPAKSNAAAAVLPPPVDLADFFPGPTPTTQPAAAVKHQEDLEALADRHSASAPVAAAPVAVPLRAATMNEPLSEELLAALLGAADSATSLPAEPPISAEAMANAEPATNAEPAAPPTLEARLQSMQSGFMTGNFGSVSESFPGVSGSFPSVMGSRASLDPDFRNLFESFQAARKASGESTDKHTHAKFLERVLKNRDEIIAKTGCRDVSFEVIIKEGKASLKATPIR